MEENCNHMASIRFFPNHHLAQHGNESGRFECSLCGYKCSHKAICVVKHIRREHRKGNAMARFNPFLNLGERRVKTEHTNECRDEKVTVKPKRIQKAVGKKTSGKRRGGKKKSKPTESSKDTTKEIVVAKENAEAVPSTSGGYKRNLESEFERPAKRKRAENSNPNDEIPSTSREVAQGVMEEEDDVTEGDIDGFLIENESEDKDDEDDIASEQSPNSESTESDDDVIVVEVEEIENDEEEDEDIFEDNLVDYNDSETNESDKESNEGELDRVIKTEANNEETQEVNASITSTREEKIQRRREIDEHMRLLGHIKAHNEYSEVLFSDLIEELVGKYTENPEKSTAELIEELLEMNPHKIQWSKISLPSRIGDETKIEDTHESVIKSAERYQVDVIEFLVNSSKRFSKQLAIMIWETLKVKTAVYRLEEETLGNGEEMKRKALVLRCLHDAYKQANR